MRTFKKLYSLITLSALILVSTLCFTACKKEYAMSLDDGKYKLDAEVYEWLVSFCKTEEYNVFVQNLQAAGEDPTLYDLTSYEFWSNSYGDNDFTLAQMVTDEAVVIGKSYLVAEKLFDEYGLTMTDDDNEAIESSITQVDASLQEDGKSLKEYLSDYDITMATYKKILTYQYKTQKLLTKLLAPGGKYEVTDEMVRDSYHDAVETLGYSNVNHVFLYSVTFEPDGSVKKLSEEDYLKIKARAQEIYDTILSGEAEFEDFLEYSDDKYSPDGYLVNVDTQMTESFVDAAVNMKIGEIKLIESEGIGFHIIKKYDITPEQKTEIEDTIRSEFEGEAEDRILDKYFDDVSVDEDMINSVDPVYAKLLL